MAMWNYSMETKHVFVCVFYHSRRCQQNVSLCFCFYSFTISCKILQLFFTTPVCLLICQIQCNLFTLSVASLNTFIKIMLPSKHPCGNGWPHLPAPKQLALSRPGPAFLHNLKSLHAVITLETAIAKGYLRCRFPDPVPKDFYPTDWVGAPKFAFLQIPLVFLREGSFDYSLRNSAFKFNSAQKGLPLPNMTYTSLLLWICTLTFFMLVKCLPFL